VRERERVREDDRYREREREREDGRYREREREREKTRGGNFFYLIEDIN